MDSDHEPTKSDLIRLFQGNSDDQDELIKLALTVLGLDSMLPTHSIEPDISELSATRIDFSDPSIV